MTTHVKICIFFILISISQINSAFAQTKEAKLLPEPTDWRLEKVNFPLDFAPDITFQGFEELRFPPGMFDRTSENYFSYAFAISITNDITLTSKELKPFLLKYYKGLCSAVAKSKKMTVNVSNIDITLKLIQLTKNQATYEAELIYFDTFNEGQKVLVHMELEVSKNATTKNSFILALASPTSKDSTIWKQLHKIRNTVTLP